MKDMPKTMRGVLLTGHGDFDKLDVRNDIPVPVPEPYDVLISVTAAAVNNTDINTRIGWYSKGDADTEDAGWAGGALSLPRIQGADVCGTIVAVGNAIGQDRVGERVLIEPCIRRANGQELEQPWYIGSECDGGFAQYVIIDAKHACKIESDLSNVELASFPCSYSTAENLLTRASVVAGDNVLITGASGGVGSAAIQLVRARGAEAIAITSAAKSKPLLDLGAIKTINREDSVVEKLGENSVDVVIDLVAGPQWPELLKVLRPGGRYAVAGAIGGPLVELDVRTLYLKDLSLFGCTVLEPEIFGNLIKHIELSKISPLVAETYPLERIVAAQKSFLTKQHIGKIVLTVES